MTEKQSDHRQALEKRVIESNCKAQERGPILGLVLCLAAIVAGVYLVKAGKDAAGLVAIIGAIATPASLFFYKKKDQTKNLSDKVKDLVISR